MRPMTIALVAPSGPFDDSRLKKACAFTKNLGVKIVKESGVRISIPTFVNGNKAERLFELTQAEGHNADAIWCVRGGCGAIELWHDYQKEIYAHTTAVLVGYSDGTVLHFLRFYHAQRIGIHGPIFLDFAKDPPPFFEAIELLINKRAEKMVYPALRRLNHFVPKCISGELIVMNLAILESLMGCVDPAFFQGKILALEDVNEPHYRIHRAMHHFKNAQALLGLKAILLGQIGPERTSIINETMIPLAEELGIPLFDWPIFGHAHPNWPLLFGALCTIKPVDDQFFTLAYNEQHDHTAIVHHES